MKASILLAALLVLTLSVSGCTTQTGTGTGKLVLQITDQPAELDIEKADMTISKVQVHVASAGNESEWITITEEPKTFNLIEIKDIKEFLGEKQLEAGLYSQIRLDIDKALVTINGTVHDLTVPSKTVKLVKGFGIEENKTTTLTLDFDAQKSIHEAGASGKYIMKPTIQIIEE